jgi:hypothetical protein
MVPSTSLSSKSTGHFKVILTTTMAGKLKGHPSWVYISRLKLQTSSFVSIPTGPTSLRISCLPTIPEIEKILNP